MDDLGNQLPPNLAVARDHIEARLARALVGSGGEHGNGRAGAVGEISGPDARGMRERHGMVEVHGLAFGLGAIGVDQDNFRREPVQQESVGVGRSDIAASDNGDARGV